jgi:hypothetical protein
MRQVGSCQARRILRHRRKHDEGQTTTLEDALAWHGKPAIFNTDQGSQFMGAAFTSVLAASDIKISMDGRGAWRDNVFVERRWRSVNTRRSICTPTTASAAREGIGRYLSTIAADCIRALTVGCPIKPISEHATNPLGGLNTADDPSKRKICPNKRGHLINPRSSVRSLLHSTIMRYC